MSTWQIFKEKFSRNFLKGIIFLLVFICVQRLFGFVFDFIGQSETLWQPLKDSAAYFFHFIIVPCFAFLSWICVVAIYKEKFTFNNVSSAGKKNIRFYLLFVLIAVLLEFIRQSIFSGVTQAGEDLRGAMFIYQCAQAFFGFIKLILIVIFIFALFCECGLYAAVKKIFSAHKLWGLFLLVTLPLCFLVVTKIYGGLMDFIVVSIQPYVLYQSAFLAIRFLFSYLSLFLQYFVVCFIALAFLSSETKKD